MNEKLNRSIYKFKFERLTNYTSICTSTEKIIDHADHVHEYELMIEILKSEVRTLYIREIKS
jgi:hypothetical protein